jgi:Amt family ammonium transporter
MGAIVVGAGVSAISYGAVVFLKNAFGYDDSLDVFGVHGLGGLWGAVATGLFGSALVAEPPSMGAQLVLQLKSVSFAAVFAVSMTLVIAYALKLVMGGLRVSEEDEEIGLDLAQHGETAYAFGTGSASFAERAHASEGASLALGAPQRKPA